MNPERQATIDAFNLKQQRMIIERMEGRPASEYMQVLLGVKEETRQECMNLILFSTPLSHEVIAEARQVHHSQDANHSS
tara:strand:- start:260 stop:496 length:237 start_codon:yes stop_codon:yes gene_type:complete